MTVKKYRVYFIWPCEGDTYEAEECTIVPARSQWEAFEIVWSDLGFKQNRKARITLVEEYDGVN